MDKSSPISAAPTLRGRNRAFWHGTDDHTKYLVAELRDAPETCRVAMAAKPVFSIQVRELVAFAHRRGDLGGERDFAGPSRALAGTRAHQRLQRSRPPGYQKEVLLRHDVESPVVILRVQGRIDGLLTTDSGVQLEEIKTVTRGWDRQADPLHWGQARCYAFIYALQNSLPALQVVLTYVDLSTNEVTEFRQNFSFPELSQFFALTAAVYLEWIEDWHRWRVLRDESIRSLVFPFLHYREGQRDLAVAAYRNLSRGGRLFLEAPTGMGKTISVLFPAIKALGEGKLERVFYLTSRTVGRLVAEQALAELRRVGLRARTVTLTAREKLCVQNGQPCDSRTCPLAIGYYDRHKPAMRAALEKESLTREALETVAHEHQVCPFQLSLDVSDWVDTVVCDYNYVFDPKVFLRRHFSEDNGDFAFLVDEAHNLVERAREMFSADLDLDEIKTVRRGVRDDLPRCAKALTKLISTVRRLIGSAATTLGSAAEDSGNEPQLFELPDSDSVQLAAPPTGAGSFARHRGGASVSRQFPDHLTPLIADALDQAEAWLAQNQPADFREDLLTLYFRLYSFQRTAELYDERYVTILEPGSMRIRLYCLDPSFLLRKALARGKAAIFFSATLTPLDYYRAVLGGSPEDSQLQFPSPFPPEHLCLLVHERIRTEFQARADTLDQVARTVASLVEGRTGNYLVYFPSYQYMASVYERFHQIYPAAATLVQRPSMTEGEREGFLASFALEREQSLVGFAVMGGIFGQGIDLVGDRLIGAVVVGVGLPQLCVERDLIRDYFQAQRGAGFDYAYTFPGMNRVLQAIGRVIRSGADRGVALLIDTRFGQTRYRRLFPPWWRVTRVRDESEVQQAVERFWSTV